MLSQLSNMNACKWNAGSVLYKSDAKLLISDHVGPFQVCISVKCLHSHPPVATPSNEVILTLFLALVNNLAYFSEIVGW